MLRGSPDTRLDTIMLTDYYGAKAAFVAWCQQRDVWPRLTYEEIWDTAYKEGTAHEVKLREAVDAYRRELLHSHPAVAHVIGMILETS